MSAAGITHALAAYQRRVVMVTFVRAAVVAACLTALATELARLRPDTLPHSAVFALFGIGAIASALYARAQQPSAIDVARHLDHAGRAQDLFVTAVECEGRDDEMSAAVTRAAAVRLPTQPSARMYPFEWPRQWRRWAALVVVTQVIAIALVWRGPDARALPDSGAAMSLPGGAPGAGTSAADTGAPGATAPPAGTQARAADSAALDVAKPADTPETPAASATANDAATSGTGASTGAAPSSASGGTGAETGDAGSRYRQAAAHASDAVAHGRVPAALRSVVERYFIAIRPERK
ncbi:MAG: hypothetical protein WCQ64_02755 [Acidobacteriota bacterium]